jgi:hypothetical protein
MRRLMLDLDEAARSGGTEERDGQRRLEAFWQRVGRGDYGDLLDERVRKVLGKAAAEEGLVLEIGALRLVLLRVLTEEADPVRQALGVSRAARTIGALVDKHRELVGTEEDRLGALLARIMDEDSDWERNDKGVQLEDPTPTRGHERELQPPDQPRMLGEVTAWSDAFDGIRAGLAEGLAGPRGRIGVANDAAEVEQEDEHCTDRESWPQASGGEFDANSACQLACIRGPRGRGAGGVALAVRNACRRSNSPLSLLENLAQPKVQAHPPLQIPSRSSGCDT